MNEIIHSDAEFSCDKKYRYALWRTWDASLPKVLFIGLNPSTADETKDDPTLRRCINYAKDWTVDPNGNLVKYGGCIMGNLFAYRSKDPKKLKEDDEPIGPDNDFWLKKLQAEACITIAAWGNRGKLHDRDQEVINLLDNLYAIKITETRWHPAHPLYLPKGLTPIPFK